MKNKLFRIHGDNIVECERTFQILLAATRTKARFLESPAFKPKYNVYSRNYNFDVEMLPGHDRWGISISEKIIANGGILRENADSYFSFVDGEKEIVLFAFEYCSALPAGNNAWQRNGRALSSVLANVPYFYFAELGGPELDSERMMKATRYPNPIVPFSYISTTKRSNSFCLPIYTAHPSITEDNYQEFKDVFGYDVFLKMVKHIIDGEDYTNLMHELINKSLLLVRKLADNRRGNNTFKGKQWNDFLSSNNPAKWIIQNTTTLRWKKKIANKVRITRTFSCLFNQTLALNCFTIGANDIPICLLNDSQKKQFEIVANKIYSKLRIKFNSNKPLAIIWITGFKPHGDDSRPDRGLSPLAKMVLGDSCDYLAVVYGPAKSSTWSIFNSNPKELAKSNGLWQSVMSICDYIIADSATSSKPFFYKNDKQNKQKDTELSFDSFKASVQFGEHDIDTVIHQLFSKNEDKGVFECLCNPPGGDWSGISYYSDKNVYRWTSLPRVSQSGAKRPDHIFQVNDNGIEYFFSIESKGNGSDLENNIGTNLKFYITDLFVSTPTSIKTPTSDWRFYNGNWKSKKWVVYSVGAFIFRNENEMNAELKRGKLDAIIAIELGEISTIHIIDSTKERKLSRCINSIAVNNRMIKIKIH